MQRYSANEIFGAMVDAAVAHIINEKRQRWLRERTMMIAIEDFASQICDPRDDFDLAQRRSADLIN